MMHKEMMQVKEKMSLMNEVTLLLDHSRQQQASVNERSGQVAKNDHAVQLAFSQQLSTRMDYRKNKPNETEPIKQNENEASAHLEPIKSVLREEKPELRLSQLSKPEFDKMVDKVFKELQKRFTFERQRRGM
jgi:hypothetical protein